MENHQSKISPSAHPGGRRRSSLAVLFADVQQYSQASPSRQLSSHVSFIKDYRRLPTPDERVAAAHKKYKRDILEKHGTNESTLDFDRNTLDEFMEGQRLLGLTKSEVLMLYREIAYQQVVEKKEANPFRTLWLFLKTMMGYADMGTDIATIRTYATLNPRIAVVQGIVLLFSFLCQLLTSVGLGQPLWVGLVGLIGMKPMLEAWRDAMEAKAFVGQKVGNDGMLWLARMVEMVVSGGVVSRLAHLVLV